MHMPRFTARFLFAAPLIAALACLAGAGAAQQATETEADATEPQMRSEEIGDWLLICSTPPMPEDATEAPPEFCEIRSAVTQTGDDGVRTLLLEVAMGPLDRQGNFWLILQTPLNVLLKQGVSLTIPATGGDGAADPLVTAKYIYCANGKCLSRAALSPEQLQALITADAAIARYVGVRDRELNVPISLSGFEEAYGAVKE